MKHHVGVNGVLRRNNFVEVRDADFQRGLNKAVENRWIKIKLRDRYTYELTEAGLAAGLNAGLPSKPSVLLALHILAIREEIAKADRAFERAQKLGE